MWLQLAGPGWRWQGQPLMAVPACCPVQCCHGGWPCRCQASQHPAPAITQWLAGAPLTARMDMCYILSWTTMWVVLAVWETVKVVATNDHMTIENSTAVYVLSDCVWFYLVVCGCVRLCLVGRVWLVVCGCVTGPPLDGADSGGALQLHLHPAPPSLSHQVLSNKNRMKTKCLLL